MTAPVEPPFLPTTEEVKAIYMKGRFDGNYASFVERNEYDLGFDQWLDAVKSAEVAALRKQIALADKAPHDWEHCGLFDRAGYRYVQPAKCTCWKAEYEAAKEATNE